MKRKFISLLLFVTIQSYSQTNPIERITLKHEYSGVVRSDIIIAIYPALDGSNSMIVQYTIKDKILRKRKTSIEKFDAICLLLKQICAADLIDNFSVGLDGSETTVFFGDWSNEISYKMWSLDSDKINKSEGYIKFIEAIEMILDTVGTNLDEINR